MRQLPEGVSNSTSDVSGFASRRMDVRGKLSCEKLMEVELGEAEVEAEAEVELMMMEVEEELVEAEELMEVEEELMEAEEAEVEVLVEAETSDTFGDEDSESPAC